MQRLARRAKNLRAAAKLTQQGAAERAKCSIAQIQAIERAGTNPTLTILMALAKAYGVTLVGLLEGV